MQFETTKWEEIRRKIRMKERDLDVWMQRNEIPDELKKRIIKSIKKKLEEDKDANLENLFNILPWDTRKDLKRFLCTKALINVCSSNYLDLPPSLPLYILGIIKV